MSIINAVVKQSFTSLVFFAFLSISLNVTAHGPIKISTFTDYPPYLHHENGQHTGLYLRIVELTLNAIAQPYTVEAVPFKRGLYQAASGDSVLIGILKTEERAKTLDFSDPFYQERVSVYFDTQTSSLKKGVEHLDGLRVGTLLGWSYGPVFDQAREANRFTAKDGQLESNFYKLAKGRLDAVIHSELSAVYVLNKLGLNDEVFLGSEPLELGNIHFAVKKGTHKDLLNRINLKLSEPSHLKKINALVESYKY